VVLLESLSCNEARNEARHVAAPHASCGVEDTVTHRSRRHDATHPRRSGGGLALADNRGFYIAPRTRPTKAKPCADGAWVRWQRETVRGRRETNGGGPEQPRRIHYVGKTAAVGPRLSNGENMFEELRSICSAVCVPSGNYHSQMKLALRCCFQAVYQEPCSLSIYRASESGTNT